MLTNAECDAGTGSQGFVSVNRLRACLVTSVVSDSLRPHGPRPARLLRPWDPPGKRSGVGCHSLLLCPSISSSSCPGNLQTLHPGEAAPRTRLRGPSRSRRKPPSRPQLLRWSRARGRRGPAEEAGPARPVLPPGLLGPERRAPPPRSRPPGSPCDAVSRDPRLV